MCGLRKKWIRDARANASLSDAHVLYFLKPARCMPRWAASFFIKVSQTNPVRTFSAISNVMPVSIPITSVSYHLVSGLNAFTNPYLLQAEGYRSLIVRNTCITGCGKNGTEPADALGTI